MRNLYENEFLTARKCSLMKNEGCRLKVTGAYRYSRDAGVTTGRGSVKRPPRKAALQMPYQGGLTGPDVKALVSKWDLALYGGTRGKHFTEHREYVGDAEWLLQVGRFGGVGFSGVDQVAGHEDYCWLV